MSDNFDYLAPVFAKDVITKNIETEMKQSYLEYAMSVIVGRALPDVRDGLKPVHRRTLYAMYECSNDFNKPYKKSARIVGDVLGKYHPHGDVSVYDTIVRMTQDFSLRVPLVDGQGNFGSVDGDAAAAMRYTEIRMAKITHEMLADIDKDTVDFIPNYDGNEKEPVVLPTKFPNLLVNGTTGIAVGMATNIPPHNLNEVIDACLAFIDNTSITIDDLIKIIPAPDFPTAGFIFGLSGVHNGYKTGRGRVVMRARTHFENINKDKEAIIIDELPYQVNKAKLCEKIGDLVKTKVIDGITEIRDESDKDGMRVVIELRRNENAEVILNNLFKLTPMQDTFGINMVALVKGKPQLLNLKDIIEAFIFHRVEIVTRRTLYELRKSKEREHLLEGLAVALANVDEMIALIKESSTPLIAKQKLMSRGWKSELVNNMLSKVSSHNIKPDWLDNKYGLKENGFYYLSDVQTQAILDLRLQKLTALEQDKIFKEYNDILDIIIDLMDILSNRTRVDDIIKTELKFIKEQFGTIRRSEIVLNDAEIKNEDLIASRDMMITLSKEGYIKTQNLEEYKTQKRGGRGKSAQDIKENDRINILFTANTHDYVLCFSTKGRLYWLKVYNIPEGNRLTRGKPIVNLLSLAENEKITSILAVREFLEDKFVFMVTKFGVIKKVALTAFKRPSIRGIAAIELDEGDELADVVISDGKLEVMLFADNGQAIRFNENKVRSTGRTSRGVRGIRLKGDSKVICMLTTHDESAQVLTATEKGYGKRSTVSEYRKTNRGGSGVIAIAVNQRNGKLIGATLVDETDEIMLISTSGVLVRTKINKIRKTGRTAQGVKLINLDENELLIDIEKINVDNPDIELDKIQSIEIENDAETDSEVEVEKIENTEFEV